MYFRKYQIAVSLFLVFVLGFSLVLKFSLARDLVPSQSLEVSPPSQEVGADPGSVVTVKGKIRNRGKSSININVRVEDFTAQGQEGQVALVDNGEQSLSSWTVLDSKQFELAAGEMKEVKATVRVPARIAGGRYGAFVFSVGGGTPGENSAAVSQELASLFLIKVNGEVKESLEMTEFLVPAFQEFGPIPFTVKFTNFGNIHVRPFGIINVRDVFGNKVKDIVIRGETNIFPGASRLVRASLDEKWLFGPYTVQIMMNYGSKNEQISMTNHFFVFPIRIALIIFLIIFIIYRGRHRIRKAWEALSGK